MKRLVSRVIARITKTGGRCVSAKDTKQPDFTNRKGEANPKFVSLFLYTHRDLTVPFSSHSSR